MGHRRLGAYVREAELAGAAMLRLDIPEHPWVAGCTCGSGDPASTDHEKHDFHCFMFRAPGDEVPGDVYATQFYSAAAMYCLTPTTEEMARAVRSRPEPVQQWELPRRELLPAAALEERDEEFDHDDYRDDEPLEPPF
jgi:hypothetical protein